MIQGPLVKKPLGVSKLGGYGGTFWNNSNWGACGPITCEICGTVHPEQGDETYQMSRFLGLQVVEECCGVILDRVYRESGEEFVLAFLREFAENPAASRFFVLRRVLVDKLEKAAKILDKVAAEVGKAKQSIKTPV